MRNLTLLLVLAVCGVWVSPLPAAERAWHEGTILAVEQQQKTITVKHSDTEYSHDGKGKGKAESSSSSNELPTEVYKIFTITDGQKTYEARQGGTVWHAKSKGQPGDKVQFAVDGDSLYVQLDGNKEVKMKILKSSLASSSNAK
jgi:hypothetical protein